MQGIRNVICVLYVSREGTKVFDWALCDLRRESWNGFRALFPFVLTPSPSNVYHLAGQAQEDLKTSIFILRYWQLSIFSEYTFVQDVLAVPISVCKLRPQVPFLTIKIQNRRLLDWFREGKMPTSTHKVQGFFSRILLSQLLR